MCLFNLIFRLNLNFQIKNTFLKLSLNTYKIEWLWECGPQTEQAPNARRAKLSRPRNGLSRDGIVLFRRTPPPPRRKTPPIRSATVSYILRSLPGKLDVSANLRTPLQTLDQRKRYQNSKSIPEVDDDARSLLGGGRKVSLSWGYICSILSRLLRPICLRSDLRGSKNSSERDKSRWESTLDGRASDRKKSSRSRTERSKKTSYPSDDRKRFPVSRAPTFVRMWLFRIA